MVFYIYEVLGEKNGATKDWEIRRDYNFDEYQIEPIIVETMEGPDTEDFWQVVGDREWYYADLNGYTRGTHYRVMRTKALKGYLHPNKRSNGFPVEATRRGGAASKGKPERILHCTNISKLGVQSNNKKVTCPYCNKEGQSRAMKRWHFDNCKHKKTLTN